MGFLTTVLNEDPGPSPRGVPVERKRNRDAPPAHIPLTEAGTIRGERKGPHQPSTERVKAHGQRLCLPWARGRNLGK